MPKSAQAFRTIREVADWLDVAAHVLRFWESKFNQIKPVKRAGGRRYYRPADMELVGGIKVLLHDRGLTIRGVQKMISDEGVEAVTSLSPPIDELIGDADVIDLEATDGWAEDTAAETDAQSDYEDDTPDPEPELEQEAETLEPADKPADEPPAPQAAPEPDEQPEPTPPEPTTDTHDDTPRPVVPQAAPRPASNPAEGPIGALAALTQLSPDQRTALRPHFAALAQLRDRMSAPPRAG